MCPALTLSVASARGGYLNKELQALYLHEPKLIYVGNVTGRALRTERLSRRT